MELLHDIPIPDIPSSNTALCTRANVKLILLLEITELQQYYARNEDQNCPIRRRRRDNGARIRSKTRVHLI